MNLKRRLLLTSATLVLVTLTLTGVAYRLLTDMQFHVHSISEEYGELQHIQQIDDLLTTVRTAILFPPLDRSTITNKVKAARKEIARYIDEQEKHVGETYEHMKVEENISHRIARRLDLLQHRFDGLTDQADPLLLQDSLADVTAIHTDLRKLAHAADMLVDDALQETHRAGSLANTLVLGLCGLSAGLAVLFTVLHYRWFITPIQRLRNRVRKAVTEEKAQDDRGDDLLGDLDAGFTELVSELDELYRTLEVRVATQSRELVKSERLASVGYLAAGVAHEINNPLNTILGYCELTLRSLNNSSAHAASKENVQSLEVIRNETLRCRQIVDKLLSLVRKSDAPREPVDLAQVVQEVIGTLDMLKQFRRCTFEVCIPTDTPLLVLARESEMKQVLLNLAINAAEATADVTGRVRITGEIDGTDVVLRVTDNGKGMTPDVLPRVFEPFFTEKRGGGQSGTGLGLSIVHAIVHDHHGIITAQSPGPGQGSTFILSLPQLHADDSP